MTAILDRRLFLALSTVAALSGAWSPPARAQAPRAKRVMFLWNVPEGDPSLPPRAAVFGASLEKAGWTASNFALEARYDAGNQQRIAAYLAEIAAAPPDVIVAVSFPIAAAVAAATKTVPIIQLGGTDPVSQGLVASLAHPDGNLTAFPGFVSTLGEKWLEILLDIAPATETVGYLYYPALMPPIHPGYLSSIQNSAKTRKVAIVEYPVTNDSEIAAAVADLARRPHGALLIQPDNFMIAHRAEIIADITRARLPSATGYEPYANEGGLASYAANTAELYIRTAGYVDALLRGEKIPDLPIQAPAVLDLVINMKAATAMGIAIPPGVLLRAARTID